MNKRWMLFVVFLLLAVAVSDKSWAQISTGGTPTSFVTPFAGAVPTVKMIPVDRIALLAEDAKAGKDAPLRFAAALDVSLDMRSTGVWTELANGDRVWRLRIESDSAYSLGLTFSKWYIPEGGQLFVYNDDHSHMVGAFTSFNNWSEGSNIIAPVPGSAVTLEYLEPAAVRDQSELVIFQVTHAYRNIFGRDGSLDDFGGSGSCNNNVMCPEGTPWANQRRGVGMIIESGSRICSGSLINNTALDHTPYFLTANHCYSSSATGWVFMFRYWSATCSPTVDGPTTYTIANATLKARYATSDFCLMQMSSTPPTGWNVYYNGWNKVDAASTNSVCIHHPDCDVMKITFDNNAPVSSGYNGASGNNHWHILAWDDGTTEPGSSGSPLFDQNHRITGQLHGGTATCTNNVDDYFGKFATSWAGGGASTSRLSNWLDPASTGVSTLDGLEGGSTTPTITLTVPNGGESWAIGDANNITWTSANLSENVKIELNRAYPGSTWETIIASTSNTGTYAWTVTGAATTTARVRITGVTTTTCGDTSAANFTIGTRSLTLTAPNGGETWLVGDANSITWTSTVFSENVKIELNRAYPGSTWETIVASTSNSGSYAWTVTGAATSAARVRITGVTHTAVGDSSNNNFTIALRTITVTLPNGGESWLVGDINNITWSSNNLTENVKIELNRAYPGTTWETIIASTANTGSYAWTLTGAATSAARVRITGVTHTTVGDSSNNNFTIALRTLTVTVPNGGETWLIGDANNITWTSTNLSENVKIELNRAYPGSTWETVIASTANTGSYAWTVTGAATTAAKVRITGVTHTTVGDSSNAVFTISARTVNLTVPNGGETWLVGEVYNILWTSNGLSENVKLELNRSYPGSTWEVINASASNTGTYAWSVTSPVSSAARVRISGVTHTTVGDTSSANFTIGQRSLTVTSPNGGENWAIGALHSILWSSQSLTGNVNVELNRNYPGGAWESLGSNVANSGSLSWTPTAPVSSTARVRVTGVSYPTVTDVSDNDFILYAENAPPQISHDPLHDQQLPTFIVTARVTDDAPGFVTRMLYWPAAGGTMDSVLLSATGNPNEFAASAGPLAENRYVYFVRVIDAGGWSARSDTGYFEVRSSCGSEQAFDDGSAEVSSWSDSLGFKWAVKFDALATPYILCGARIGVSAVHPDSAHSPVSVFVYLADGAGGLPGTLLWSKTAGSIGNVIGGLPENPDNWTWVATRDGSGNPLQLSSAFYVAVANPVAGKYESFLSDTSSARAGRSFVYDPCDSIWHNELDGTAVAQAGNRMIRAIGFGLTPPVVVIIPVDTGLKLTWTSSGAPAYHVYKSATPSGALTWVGATSDTTMTDTDLSDVLRFYTVLSATP